MAEIFSSNLFSSFTPKASDMDEYHKHLVDSLNEEADATIPKVGCLEKIDKLKIDKDALKLIKENVNSNDSMPRKNCHQLSHPSISCTKKLIKN